MSVSKPIQPQRAQNSPQPPRSTGNEKSRSFSHQEISVKEAAARAEFRFVD